MKVHALNAEGLQGSAELAAVAAAKGKLKREIFRGWGRDAMRVTLKLHLVFKKTLVSLPMTTKGFSARISTMRLPGFFCVLFKL